MARLKLVEPVMFMHMFCLSAHLLLVPFLLEEKIGDKLGYNGSQAEVPCQDDTHNTNPVDSSYSLTDTSSDSDKLRKRVEADAAVWYMYLQIATLVPSVISCLLLGAWSDSIGRRRVLLIGTLGTFVTFLGVICLLVFHLPLSFLFAPWLLSGLAGGNPAMLMGISAYVADVSGTENRSVRLTIAEAVLFLAVGLGQVITGVAMEKFGLLATEVSVAIVQLVQILYLSFVLAEPNDSKEKKKVDSLLAQLRHLLRQLYEEFVSASSHRLPLWLLVVGFMLSTAVLVGGNSVTILYAGTEPFCLTSSYIGYMNVYKFGMMAFVGIVLAPILIKVFHLSDHALAQVSIWFFIGTQLVMAFGKNVAMLWIGSTLALPFVIATSMFRAMSSKLVIKERQGTVFSLIASTESLSTLIGALIFNNLFSVFVQYKSSPILTQPAGYTFLVMAVVLVPSSLLLYGAKRNSHNYHQLSILNSSVQDYGSKSESTI